MIRLICALRIPFMSEEVSWALTSFPTQAAFEPQVVKAMTDAYDSVVLKINGNGTPAIRELVAKRIIELVAAGEQDAERLESQILRDIVI